MLYPQSYRIDAAQLQKPLYLHVLNRLVLENCAQEIFKVKRNSTLDVFQLWRDASDKKLCGTLFNGYILQ